MEVDVRGDVDAQSGWVLDCADIKDAIKPLFAQLDHNYLNEIEGLSNPTSEVLAKWIWNHLQPELPSLSKIAVDETCTSGCVYGGPESER